MKHFKTQSTTRDYGRLQRAFLFCILLLTGLSNACNPPASHRYPIAGEIVSVDRNRRQIVVSHGEIQGYMPAMVMPFKLKSPNLLQTLTKGDNITATLVVADKESWLENISVVSKGTALLDSRDADIRALPREGDEVPDFSLVNQDGKKISLKQYRGKALLITFIYTRCPLPDYCPLMSSNFAGIDKDLQKEPALYAKTHLLSVSFDFKYDTPAVLRSYGAAYTEKYSEETFQHWEFASGTEEEVQSITKFFGLRYSQTSDQINHDLVTAIVSPDGKVFKIYAFNDWKPSDVLNDLRSMKLS